MCLQILKKVKNNKQYFNLLKINLFKHMFIKTGLGKIQLNNSIYGL